MTLYRAQVLDTPDDPFAGALLRSDADAGLLVRDGTIAERAGYADLAARHPDEPTVDLSEGLLLPGFVDTHVHFPQLRAIGALGMPLLDWLDRCALPEEARFADVSYARGVAGEFVAALAEAGTTTALVFGAHFAAAVDALFAAGAERGLRVTSGLVVGDRMLRAELYTTAERAYTEGRALADRWHGVGQSRYAVTPRLALADRWHGVGQSRYAVTPRFSLSCTDDLLASCADLHRDVAGSWFTSHVNENLAEVAAVHRLFAHNVHATQPELRTLAAQGASVAHCPTSNAALGSGLFPLDRHLAAGVRVALGSDVGAGTGFSLFKEGLQAYFLQQLRGADGVPLTGAHLLYLATAAGADALGMREQVGDLGAGRCFDALWLRPPAGSTLQTVLRHASDPADALAKTFALATPADVAAVWVNGEPVKEPGWD